MNYILENGEKQKIRISDENDKMNFFGNNDIDYTELLNQNCKDECVALEFPHKRDIRSGKIALNVVGSGKIKMNPQNDLIYWNVALKDMIKTLTVWTQYILTNQTEWTYDIKIVTSYREFHFKVKPNQSLSLSTEMILS